jgi:acyl-CoA synthetase (AMP-forming)/AMP-acid ligase II
VVTPDIHRVTRTPRKPRLTGLAPHLAALVQDTVGRGPQAEAIADLGTGRRLRYAGLWDEASRVAGGLLAAGVRPGGRVAIRLPNGADWCLAFLGVTLAGAIPIPVSRGSRRPRPSSSSATAGPRRCWTDSCPTGRPRPS